jgi:hypothetical protein
MLTFLVAWTWIELSGTVCYVDAPEKIPAAYRAEARRVEIGPLADYARLTPVPQWNPEGSR